MIDLVGRYFRKRRFLATSRKTQLSKDSFGFTSTVNHGFPHRPKLTCLFHATDLVNDVYEKLVAAGKGVASLVEAEDAKDSGVRLEILITGHEDGSVCFWSAGETNLELLTKIETSKLFNIDETDHLPSVDGEPQVNEESKYAVNQIIFSQNTGELFVGGSSGQVMHFELGGEAQDLIHSEISLSDSENLPGKKLSAKTGPVTFDGFVAKLYLQVLPPSPVSAMYSRLDQGIFVVGTHHGFGIYDTVQNKVVYTKCTYVPPAEVSASDESAPSSARKTLSRTLRNSFRRIRPQRVTSPTSPEKKTEGQTANVGGDEENATTKTGDESENKPPTETNAEAKPEETATTEEPKKEEAPTEKKEEETKTEEKVEEDSKKSDKLKKQEDSKAAVIQYLYVGFCSLDKKDSQASKPTIFAGTHGGVVYGVSLNIPAPKKTEAAPQTNEAATSESKAEVTGDKAAEAATTTPAATETTNEVKTEEKPAEAEVKAEENDGELKDVRLTEPVTIAQENQLTLGHKAPVLFIEMVDRVGNPLSSNEHGERLLVCTEEQFTYFSLPALKHVYKYKLYAGENLRATNVSRASITSKSDAKMFDYALVVLTNNGILEVFTYTDFDPCLKATLVGEKGQEAVLNNVFTARGQGFCLHEPWSIRRYSLCMNPALIVGTPPVATETVVEEKKEETVSESQPTKETQVTPVKPTEEEKPVESSIKSTEEEKPVESIKSTEEEKLVESTVNEDEVKGEEYVKSVDKDFENVNPGQISMPLLF